MKTGQHSQALIGLAKTLPIASLYYVGSRPERLKLFETIAGTASTVIFNQEDAISMGSNGTAPSDGLEPPPLLSDADKEDTVYTANARGFSGLIRPEKLQPYWQNLETIEENKLKVCRLDSCVERATQVVQGNVSPNWLFVDCLPSGRILRGSEGLIPALDVILVRALVEEVRDNELQDSSLASLRTYLRRRDFELITTIPDRHVAFATIVFAKDWKRLHIQQTVTLSESLKQSNEQLDRARQEHDKVSHELNEVKLASADLQAKLDAREQELKQVRQELTDAITAQTDMLKSVLQASSENKVQSDKIRMTIDQLQHNVLNISSDVRETRYVQYATLNGTKSEQTKQLVMRANAHFQAGEFKRASEIYRLAVSRSPKHAWSMQGLAESLARFQYKPDPDWTAQEHVEGIEGIGRWDVTVRLYRKALSLDPQIAVAFNETFPTKPDEGHDDRVESPVFIVGCGHSGTSIMVRILGNHPDIMPIKKESALFLKNDEVVTKTMAEWDTEAKTQNFSHWVEKTPPHIFQMHRLFGFRPNAKFIIMLRDGRDVIASLRKRPNYDKVRDRIDRWVFDNLAGLPYWDHPQVKIVKYEDFVGDPTSTMGDIFSFLKLKLPSSILDYHNREANWYSKELILPDAIETQADHNNLRNWQINQPVFDGRGKWKTELSAQEKRAIKASRAQELLEKFGYVSSEAW